MLIFTNLFLLACRQRSGHKALFHHRSLQLSVLQFHYQQGCLSAVYKVSTWSLPSGCASPILDTVQFCVVLRFSTHQSRHLNEYSADTLS